MLRSAIIAFAIAFGTILGSASANATVTVFGSMMFDLRDLECPPPGGCTAELDPSNPEVQVNISAGPDQDVNVTNSVDFSLYISDPEGVAGGVDLHVDYLFLITLTNPLFDSGDYNYYDTDIAVSCFSPSPFCSFSDFNDYEYFFRGDQTINLIATIDAHAASIPEPSSVGLLASALFFLAWLHPRRRNERHE